MGRDGVQGLGTLPRAGGDLALSREVIGEAEVIALRQERRRKRPHEHIPCRRSEV